MFMRHSNSAFLHFILKTGCWCTKREGIRVIKRTWGNDRYLRGEVDLAIDDSIILIDMTRVARHVFIQCCSVTF